MLAEDFVHLHIHSEYSLLDGSIKIKKLVSELSKRGAKAAALTDHDAMHGVLEFYLACQAEKINGIIGYEINVEPFLLSDKKVTTHLTLLAENAEGYANLKKLCTIANTTGKDALYLDSTNVTLDEIKNHCSGLICLSGCFKGEISRLVSADKLSDANLYLQRLIEIFGKENLYIELMDNGIVEQNKLIPNLVLLAAENQLEIVATANVHYLQPDDKETHMLLLAIKHKLKKSDMLAISAEVEFHMPTFAEMEEKFSAYPMALENTKIIADRCHLKINTKSIYMPDYQQKPEETSDDCLIRLAREGLEARKTSILQWMQGSWSEYQERLEYELSVILKMKFAGYFLIVQDFINWAKENKIPVGPGRGSAAGSLVTYSLRITNIDPIRFNLLFERFLNPERISMPDIDTDFCQDRREDVLQYVYQKYGYRAVSQIVTFGRMMARNALKNLARISGWSFHDSNEFAKLIPETPGMTLEQAAKEEEKIRERLEADERAKTLWDGALAIEGTLSSLGIHAAGVIISDRALDEHCPLLETEGQLLTQFENKYAEKIGLIKFDFLGLKTLTVIDKTVNLINANIGKVAKNGLDEAREATWTLARSASTSDEQRSIGRSLQLLDIDNIELEDPKVYEMISTAHVTGVFQLESMGMRKLIADLVPSCFNDIIAVLALFRPGPLGSGMVEDFVKRKHGRIQVEYPLPELEPILSDTYGVIVYQEQVQKIAAVLANYSLGEADLLRRAMGKKDKNEMERQKNRFVSGAVANNQDSQKSADLFDLMAKFAEYGFNKSHSAAYGLVTYQTAWLKTYYPTEFMTAIMSCDIDNTDKIVTYVRDCKRMKIKVLPPCVNHSYFEFFIEGELDSKTVLQFGSDEEKPVRAAAMDALVHEAAERSFDKVSAKLNNRSIRFALGAIKGLGSGIIQLIVDERKKNGIFHSVPEFMARLDARKLNKKVMESLIKAGAFDSISPHRALLLENSDFWIRNIAKEIERNENSNCDLFGLGATSQKDKISQLLRSIQIKEAKPWSFHEQLSHEFAALGFYMSAHPADFLRSDFTQIAEASLDKVHLLLEPDDLLDYKRKNIRVAGIVTMLQEKKNKEGSPFLILKIEDGFGELDLTLFSKQYAALLTPLKKGDALLVECKIKRGIEQGGVKGIIQNIANISDKRVELAKSIVLNTSEEFLKKKQNMKQLEDLLCANKGLTPLFIEVHIPEQKVKLRAKMGNHSIKPTDDFIMAVENICTGLVKVERIFQHQIAEVR